MGYLGYFSAMNGPIEELIGFHLVFLFFCVRNLVADYEVWRNHLVVVVRLNVNWGFYFRAAIISEVYLIAGGLDHVRSVSLGSNVRSISLVSGVVRNTVQKIYVYSLVKGVFCFRFDFYVILIKAIYRKILIFVLRLRPFWGTLVSFWWEFLWAVLRRNLYFWWNYSLKQNVAN